MRVATPPTSARKRLCSFLRDRAMLSVGRIKALSSDLGPVP